jgi:hypothetical protein
MLPDDIIVMRGAKMFDPKRLAGGDIFGEGRDGAFPGLRDRQSRC